jgi:protein-disulfide isomerase
MVFRNFPFLGPESTAAAQAAQCAEDGNKLWAYHDALYQAKVNDVSKGGSENDGFLTRAVFIELASQVGLDVPTFTSCIDSNKYATLVSSDYAAAQAAGVDSTPTTFVNGAEVTDSSGNSVGANQSAILSAIQSALAAK